MPVLTAEELPLLQRLALSYAAPPVRLPFLALLALDQRLGQFVSQATEPLLGQMRLAWWRDELRKAPEARPEGDPILELIGQVWRGEEGALVDLVDGWEELLAEPPLPEAAPGSFAAGRAAAFVGAARIAGMGASAADVSLAAQRWALADLAAKISDAEERTVVVAAANALGFDPVRLPRALRTLTILDGLAITSLKNGGSPLLQGRGTILRAMRLGLLGR